MVDSAENSAVNDLPAALSPLFPFDGSRQPSIPNTTLAQFSPVLAQMEGAGVQLIVRAADQGMFEVGVEGSDKTATIALMPNAQIAFANSPAVSFAEGVDKQRGYSSEAVEMLEAQARQVAAAAPVVVAAGAGLAQQQLLEIGQAISHAYRTHDRAFGTAVEQFLEGSNNLHADGRLSDTEATAALNRMQALNLSEEGRSKIVQLAEALKVGTIQQADAHIAPNAGQLPTAAPAQRQL